MGAAEKIFLAANSVALIFFILSVASSQILRDVDARLKIQVCGRFEPVPFQPSFYLRKAQLTLKEKVKLISGDLKVNYSLTQLFQRNNIRLQLEGKNLDVEFLENWAPAQGIRRLTLQSFYADLGFDRAGLKEIYAVNAKSPSFQFRIQRTENKDKAIPVRGEKP